MVNQRVVGMNYRSVSIKGTPKAIANACRKIYNSLEKFSTTVEDVEKVAVSDSLHLNFRNLFKLKKSKPKSSLWSRRTK